MQAPSCQLAACAGFRDHYGADPTKLAAAPGRVNLLGGHVDYNAGLVLPMAIDRYTVLAADRGGERARLRAASAALPGELDLPADAADAGGGPRWAAYVFGVLAAYRELGLELGGLRLWIESDVPAGGGLSSSAALEAAAATLAEALGGPRLEPLAKARLCQRAEHEHAGVPCGIMDQVASLLGEPGHALLLDCRSLAVERLPLAEAEVGVLVFDTAVPRALGSSEYGARRAQCERAAGILGVAALRDASLERVAASAPALGPELVRRARHVVTEITRVGEAAGAIRAGDWTRCGRLMNASHASLRDDYGVSCAELDAAVELARGIGPEGGVLGSRLTGAGFGGCTVTLVRRDRAEAVAAELTRAYRGRTGLEGRALAVSAGRGACVLQSLAIQGRN